MNKLVLKYFQKLLEDIQYEFPARSNRLTAITTIVENCVKH